MHDGISGTKYPEASATSSAFPGSGTSGKNLSGALQRCKSGSAPVVILRGLCCASRPTARLKLR
eukprot:5774300-Prorocentrum_lima.AAC.1